MKTIQVDGASKPIFSWCPDIEQKALDQMIHLAKLPFVTHCALMPDAHMGHNMPIGGVIATDNVIIMDAVGVDIGCGMGAVKTSLKREQLEDVSLRERIHHAVSRGIPMGFAHNSQVRINQLKNTLSEKVSDAAYQAGIVTTAGLCPIEHAAKTIYEQLGTLGGGNHFLEIQYAEDDSVWMMVHSGSRNIGKTIGEYFNKIASVMNKKWHSVDTGGIPFLPADTSEGRAYLSWMDLALRFAFLNRSVMIEEMKKDLQCELEIDIQFEPVINIHHNFASIEHHMGRNVWVHRKGATVARKGTVGIIPGSMGTASYIVNGLGSDLSLESCSHGSGRVMGRKEFNIQNNTPEKLKEIEDAMQGITHTRFGRSQRGRDKGMKDVSESPKAYKDIEDVIKNESDLVTPIVKLRPIINWKSEDPDD